MNIYLFHFPSFTYICFKAIPRKSQTTMQLDYFTRGINVVTKINTNPQLFIIKHINLLKDCPI